MSLQVNEPSAKYLVEAGYKHTEIGFIPQEWSVMALAGIAAIERGKFSARPRNDPRYYGGEFPFIQTSDVTRSSGSITTFTQTLNREGLRVSRLFPEGTLFFTIAANIGDVGIAKFQAACPDSLVAIVPHVGVQKGWLLYELARRKSDFESLASPGAQLNINLEKLRPYLLPVPTEAEQQAIAAALSDVDALIAGLEKLIAKKRDLKQAAMQQLLTGQTRLPGFSGEWLYAPIHELEVRGLLKLSRGNVISKSDIASTPGEYPIYSSSIHNNGEFGRYGKYMFDEELITWSVDGGGNFFYRPAHKFSVTNVCGFMRAKTESLNHRFLAYQLQQQHSQKSFDYQTKAHPSVVRAEYVVAVPSLDEQTSIANLLSNMDFEIEKLGSRLAKTRELKQGMMQELLTGRTRLVLAQSKATTCQRI